MEKEEKSVELHLLTPMIYSKEGELGWVKIMEIFFDDELELVSYNGEIYCPTVEWGKREHKDLLVRVRESEEEIRKMVNGKLRLVEFSKHRNDTIIWDESTLTN